MTLSLLVSSLLVSISGCATTTASTVSSTSPRSSEAAAAEVSIGGSGEAYAPLEILAEAHQAKTGTKFEFFPPSQTSGGVEGVKNSTFDIGGVSKGPTEAGISDSMTYLPLIVTPLVVVVHDSVTGVTDLSADQIKGIYSGEITNWKALGGPDVDIVLFDLSEDESEKQVLRQAYLGDDFAISDAAVVFEEDDELAEAVAVTDFSIAALPLEDELEDLPINILSIDGVAPSAENIEAGTYLMGLPLGIAVSDTPSAEAQAFVDFISSDEGRTLLADADLDDD